MEKFVTDLDKLLDDFESSNDIAHIVDYDSSGYKSLDISSDLNTTGNIDGRETPVAIKHDSNHSQGQITPTKNNSTHFNNNNHEITINTLSDDDFIPAGNISIQELDTENIEEDPTDFSNQLITVAQADKRRTLMTDNSDVVTSPSPIHSQMPPRKKLRPNSLVGLSSVTSLGERCEESVRPKRPQSLSLCEELIDDVCVVSDPINDGSNLPSIVINDTSLGDDKESESAMQGNTVLDSIDNAQLPQPDSISAVVDDIEVWQGIPVEELGLTEPIWITDDTSVSCMQCEMPFSMFRRRHHCRACGRLLCNKCCSWRMQLHFSSKLFPKDRVCAVCFQYLIRVEAARKQGQNIKSSNLQPLNSVLKSNRPSSLAISPNSMSSSSNHLVPESLEASFGPKSVMFADGIRPGGDLTESEKAHIITPTKFQTPPQVRVVGLSSPEHTSREPLLLDVKDDSYLSLQIKEKLLLHKVPDGTGIIKQGSSVTGDQNFLIFPITKNLHVHLQLIHLPYCTCSIKNGISQECDCDSVECWFFASLGLETIGVEEIVIILKRLPAEVNPPTEILKYYFQVYQKAFKNETKLDSMEMTVEIFSESIHLKEWAGILHIRPTFQCLNKIPHLPTPYLVGILIHRWEFPWAMLLPLRLILALGNQSRFYPCSLISDRNRPPVYGEVGQTILQLVSPIFAFPNNLERGLCDSSIVPAVPGMWLHLLASQETIVQIPKHSYTHLLNILSCRKSESSPLALAASFSREADSHLVCCQNEETGQYYSRAISIQNTERVVTASTMILFIPRKDNDEHGTTIVEDAIVVKLSQMHLGCVINSLKTMADLALQCASYGDDSVSSSLSKTMIKIAWTESRQMSDMASVDRPSLVSDETIQSALGSLLDDGDKIIKSYRVPSSIQNMSLDKENQSPTQLKIIWTRFHLVEAGNAAMDSSYEDPVDYVEMIREIAITFANAVIPFLEMLREIKLVNIGLRTKIGPDNVTWFCGCSRTPQYICRYDQSPIEEPESRNGSYFSSKIKNDQKLHFNNVEALPDVCIDYLDEFFVPFLYSKTTLIRNGSLISELEFHIID